MMTVETRSPKYDIGATYMTRGKHKTASHGRGYPLYFQFG